MFYWLLTEVLGFSYGVEETEEAVPKGAEIFPNEEALELAAERAQKEVDAEFEAFQKEADEGLPLDEEPVKEEDPVVEDPNALDEAEKTILQDFEASLDHDTIKKKHKVSQIRSLARKLGIDNPAQLNENELCEAIDAKLKER